MSSAATIWTTRCPVPSALSIAIANDALGQDLARRNVRIRSLASSADPAVRQAHFVQSQSYFIRQGGNTPPLVSASRGARLKILGLSWARHNEGLFALPGSGINAQRDIRGKRISLPRQLNDPIDFWRGTVQQGVCHFLKRIGLTEDDIRWVDVNITRTYVSRSTESTDARKTLWDSRFMLGHQREEAAALLSGAVDLIYSAGSIATLTAGFTGAVKLYDLSTDVPPEQRPGNATPVLLTTTADLLEERPELVDLIVAHTLQAAAWSRDHAADAKRIIAIETGLPEDLVDDAWSPAVHQNLDIDLSDTKVRTLERQVDFLARNGFFADKVDLDDLIAPEPLARATTPKRRASSEAARALAGAR